MVQTLKKKMQQQCPDGWRSGHGSQRGYRLALQPMFLGFLLTLIFTHGSQTLAADNRDANKAEEYSRILKDLTLGYRDVDSASSAGSPENGVHRRQYRDLHNSECSESAKRIDAQCALDCQCIDGRWKCCRHRKSYEHLSEAERERFVNAYVVASTDPRYKPAFTSILWSHALFVCKDVKDYTKLNPLLLSYHRALLLALENLLRRIDCRITLPFWDVPKHYTSPWAEQPPMEDRHVLGGDGQGSHQCVKDGMLAQGKYSIPTLRNRGAKFPLNPSCLRRQFNNSHSACPWPLVEVILSLPSSQSLLLLDGLFSCDTFVHRGVGGSFRGLTLPADPLFAMSHSYTDKLLATYQSRGADFMAGNGLFNGTERVLAFPWFQARDLMDANNLPGGVCISWGESMPREKAISSGYYAALEIPRTDHLFKPYTEVREMQIKGKRAAMAVRTLLKYFHQEFTALTFDRSGFHYDAVASQEQTAAQRKEMAKQFNKNSLEPALCKEIVSIDPQFMVYNVTGPRVDPV